MTPPRSDGPYWLTAIYKFGVPSAIALFFVWWLTSVVSASLTTIRSQLNDHITTTNLYLFQVCRHTAKSDEERGDCPQPTLRTP